MKRYELVQLNVARMRYPMDAPEMAGFVEQIDAVNALADSADGFIWRLQTEDSGAAEEGPFGADCLVNVSVWRDVASLRAYVYGGAHVAVMRDRRAWFAPAQGPHLALWWIPAGERPSERDAAERLECLRRLGPTPEAFTFARPFTPDGRPDF